MKWTDLDTLPLASQSRHDAGLIIIIQFHHDRLKMMMRNAENPEKSVIKLSFIIMIQIWDMSP